MVGLDEASRQEGAFGGLDILVNNAVAVVLKPIIEGTAAEFDEVMRVNAKGAFFAC